MRYSKHLLAMAVAASVLTAGCATDSGGSSSGSGFKACLVSDSGGIDDKAFNQSAYEGLMAAGDELDIETSVLESKTDADYAPNLRAHMDAGCGLIITVGYLLEGPTIEAAKANPEQQFAIIDSAGLDDNGTPDDPGDDKPLPNVGGILFDAKQPSYVAGYLSAGVSESGTVGTYGGINIPPVVQFMDGFSQGVTHYNEVHGTSVEVLGWNGEDGTFAGNFDNLDDGKRITQSQVDAGADIVLPVSGAGGLGTSALAKELGSDKLKVIGTDVDQYVSNPSHQGTYLTSILKNIETAVFAKIKETMTSGDAGAPYLGTFTNDGVGIAPYHDFDDQIPDELKAEVDQLIADFKSGKLTVS